MSDDTQSAIEARLHALARDAGSPLPADAIRALAATLASSLAALSETAEALHAVEEAPAMRPALAGEPRSAAASQRR